MDNKINIKNNNFLKYPQLIKGDKVAYWEIKGVVDNRDVDVYLWVGGIKELTIIGTDDYKSDIENMNVIKTKPIDEPLSKLGHKEIDWDYVLLDDVSFTVTSDEIIDFSTFMFSTLMVLLEKEFPDIKKILNDKDNVSALNAFMLSHKDIIDSVKLKRHFSSMDWKQRYDDIS